MAAKNDVTAEVAEVAAESLVVLSKAEAIEAERGYRNGVDISLYEVADRFERDGFDWKDALTKCGYSDEQIADEVENAS
jgi:hypothetical protein